MHKSWTIYKSKSWKTKDKFKNLYHIHVIILNLEWTVRPVPRKRWLLEWWYLNHLFKQQYSTVKTSTSTLYCQKSILRLHEAGASPEHWQIKINN